MRHCQSSALPHRYPIATRSGFLFRCHTSMTKTTLTIAGDGKLKFAGAYSIDSIMGTSVQPEPIEIAHRLSCPFEGVIDGAFDACATMPLDCVRSALVECALAERPRTIYREDHEYYLDCEIARAIRACKSAGESF